MIHVIDYLEDKRRLRVDLGKGHVDGELAGGVSVCAKCWLRWEFSS